MSNLGYVMASLSEKPTENFLESLATCSSWNTNTLLRILAEVYILTVTKPNDNTDFCRIWHLLNWWTCIYFEISPISECLLFDSWVFWSLLYFFLVLQAATNRCSTILCYRGMCYPNERNHSFWRSRGRQKGVFLLVFVIHS